MRVELDTERVSYARCALGIQLSAFRELDRRSARNSLGEDGFNGRLLFAYEHESRNRELDTGKRVCGGLGNCRVPNVADLAMTFVRAVGVRVIHALRHEQAHGQHQQNGQCPFCGDATHF
jgi:hypothetical protein